MEYGFHQAVSVVYFDQACQIKTPVDAFTIQGGAEIISSLFEFLSGSAQAKDQILDFLSSKTGSSGKAGEFLDFLVSRKIVVENPVRFITQYEAVLDFANRRKSNLDDPDTPLRQVRSAKITYLQGPGRLVEQVATVLQEKEFEITSRQADAELIVHLGYGESTRKCVETNRALYALGKPFFMANVKDNLLFLGPLVLPSLTSCYHCLFQRSYANANYKREFLASHEVESELGFNPDPVIAQIYAGMIANEIVKLKQLDTRETLIDQILELDMQSLSSHRRPIVKAPRCEVCGTQNHKPLHAIRNMM